MTSPTLGKYQKISKNVISTWRKKIPIPKMSRPKIFSHQATHPNHSRGARQYAQDEKKCCKDSTNDRNQSCMKSIVQNQKEENFHLRWLFPTVRPKLPQICLIPTSIPKLSIHPSSKGNGGEKKHNGMA